MQNKKDQPTIWLLKLPVLLFSGQSNIWKGNIWKRILRFLETVALPTNCAVSLGGSNSREVCSRQELPRLWEELFVLPKYKFTKSVKWSDSWPGKCKPHPGSGDGVLNQLKCHPLISKTRFEYTVCSAWSTSQCKQLSPQHFTLLKLSA